MAIKSGGFHAKDLYTAYLACNVLSVLDLMKNTEFSGIPRNLADFMKSSGFHMQIASFAYEIWWISY